jgi:hypothetical protein
MSILPHCLPLTDQIFTHIDEDTGRETVFAVSELRRQCLRRRAPLCMTPIDRETSIMIVGHRGIEQARLNRARRTRVFAPLLYLHMPDDSHLLADGSHTYVARYLLGHKWALAYILEPQDWLDSVVVGLPSTTEAELLSSFSGIFA